MRIRSLVVTLAVLLATAGSAHAKSAVQVTPDESVILINKTVGTQQWVLALNVDVDTLTGNVFDTSGGAATFFACDVTWSDDGVFSDVSELQGQTATFVCSVASGCAALPCDPGTQWHDIGSVSPLPGSFFLP
ncbi:MAG: hypothetical protein HY271_15300 [Deltaproteobacteria bacterium]|nr:hypothetical protein [Deltaproteobacteria bacterium]